MHRAITTANRAVLRPLFWLACTAFPPIFLIAFSEVTNAEQSGNQTPAGSSTTELGTISGTGPNGVATPESQFTQSIAVITAKYLELYERRAAEGAPVAVPGLIVGLEDGR